MATLVDCPDCAREVSPTAIACPNCGCPVRDRVRTEAAAFMEAWETYEEPSPSDDEPDVERYEYLPRLFPDAHGVGLIVLRIAGLWLFITGLVVWNISANRIADRIVYGAPLPEGSIIYFPLMFGIGYMLIWGILGTIRNTPLERWIKRLNAWTAFAFGVGIYVLYTIGLTLAA